MQRQADDSHIHCTALSAVADHLCYDVCEHIEGRRSCQLLEMEPRRVSRRLSRRRRQFDARSVRMLNATCLKLKRGRSSLTFVSIVARAGCCWLCGFPTLLAVLAVCPRPPAALGHVINNKFH